VALVRTDVSEELSAYFIRVTIIGELGTTLALTSNRRTHSQTVSRILEHIAHYCTSLLSFSKSLLCISYALYNSSTHPLALRCIQLRTQMSIKKYFGLESGRHVRITNLPPSVARLTIHTFIDLRGLLRGSFSSYMWMMFYLSGNTSMVLNGMLRG
jgi:hypothetical protein